MPVGVTHYSNDNIITLMNSVRYASYSIVYIMQEVIPRGYNVIAQGLH